MGMKFKGAGIVIRQLREEAGLNVEQFAKKAGWGKSRQSQYETNKVDMNLWALEQISRALGASPPFAVLSCVQHLYQKELRAANKDSLMRSLLEILRTT